MDPMRDAICNRNASKLHFETNNYESLSAFMNLPPSDYDTWYPMVKFAEPDNLKSSKFDEMPDSSLDLDWIYGRNVGVCGGSNVVFTTMRNIVYSAGAIGVVQTTAASGESSQSYFREHSNF